MWMMRRWALSLCLMAMGAMWCCAGYGQEAEPTLVLRGTVTYADRQSYLELPFVVGKDVTRLSVELSYTGHDRHTNIDMGVWDSERFRGWSGGNKNFFTISEADATPSYLPGPVVAGTWKLILGVPNIEEGERSTYEAKVYLAHRGDGLKGSTFSRGALRAGPGWYRGDLHLHDAHSDGSCLSQTGKKVPCPLYKTVEDAAARGLDFIAITDHNTVSQFNDMRELQPYFDRVLLLPGREITTFQGHANVFGTDEFIDFRLGSSHVPKVNDLLAEVQRVHGILSINHPGAPSGAACMGCGWSAENTDYGRVHAIEAINGDSLDGPRSGIRFWEERLNEGHRLTGIGGSDNHDADHVGEAKSAVGHPTTVVYARELSDEGILDGVRAGHVFIDVDGVAGRALEMTGEAGGKTVSMGDALHAAAGERVRFQVKVSGVKGVRIEAIVDGVVKPGVAGSDGDETRSFEYVADGKRHWVRVNVRAEDGRLLLVGNPIYLEESK